MNPVSISEESINRLYDTYLVPYALSFSDVWMMNWGYWTEETLDVSASQINLIIRMFENTKVKNKKVLDVGCGVGGTAVFINNHFFAKSVDGININPLQIKMANKLALEKNCSARVRFKTANASQLPYKDRTFDIIIAVECAFHFLRKDLFIGEAYRILKPNGKLIIADINLTENARLADSFNNELKEFYEGLQIPELARISDWNHMLVTNHFSEANVEDMTEHSAISLSQIIKNSTNSKIYTIQEKLNNFNGNGPAVNRKWDDKWFMLLGNLSFNKVMSYNIIRTIK